MDDFFAWLDSDSGQDSAEALHAVLDAVENAELDVTNQKIIFPAGSRMSIEEAAAHIQATAGGSQEAIVSHLIGWMQMSYVPDGLDEKQMEFFERKIEDWLEKYDTV